MRSLTLKRSDYFTGAAHPVAVEHRYPQDIFPLHSHDFDEIVIVWRGNGLHIWNGLPYRITYGDVLYVTQQDKHYYQSVENLELVNILFCRDRLRLGTDWNSLLPGIETHQESRSWRLTGESLALIHPHIERLAGECSRKDLFSLRLTESIFLELVLLLMRHRYQAKKPASHARRDIDLVMAALGSNMSERFELESLCVQHQLSPRSVRDTFKQVTGMTISRYQMQRRLCHAINLLSSSELPISEVASISGFSDSNYFSVIFQKTFNQSPSHCRRVLQERGTGRGHFPFSDHLLSSGDNV
ncbi:MULTISPECIES: helix-turn-helix domain-containing protein [Buttiauxella]|nr:helix-turn-helix domain-containing protein [Buttiauxella sp. BIGb0552]TDX11017.1 AraC family L-rhamnose operon transcriptional activator RhaR [Buttiauxella sp. BIGb0552]